MRRIAHQVRFWLPPVLITLLLLCIFGSMAAWVGDRVDETRDFRSQLIAAGFAENPSRSSDALVVEADDELSATVNVADCPVVLKKEYKFLGSAKTYIFSRVAWGADHDGISVTDGPDGIPDFTTLNPTHQDIYDYLLANVKYFTCAKAKG